MTQETKKQQNIRRLRRDGRTDENLNVVAYENEASQPLAWTGDDEAPYVKILHGDTDDYTLFDSAALVETGTIYAGDVRLFKATIINGTATLYYFFFFNGTIATANIVWRGIVPASGGVLGYDFDTQGIRCRTALRFAVSSTLATYTAPGVKAVTVDAAYRAIL
jgi:hypothetical protein